MTKELILDGGYGLEGNISLKILLDNLPKNKRKEFEKELEKKDKEAYTQFKKWEKDYDNFNKE